VRGKGVHCPEIAPVKGKQGVGPVVGGEPNIDCVGQVQVEAGVLLLDQACGVEDLDAGFGDLEPHLPSLGYDEINDRGPGTGSEAGLGQMISLGEHER